MTAQTQRSSMVSGVYAMVSVAGFLVALAWFFGGSVRSVVSSSGGAEAAASLVPGQLELTLLSLGLLFGHLIFILSSVRERLDARWVRWVALIQIFVSAVIVLGAGFLGLVGGSKSFSHLLGLVLLWSMPFIAIAVGSICVWAAQLGRSTVATGWAVTYLALYPFTLFLGVLR